MKLKMTLVLLAALALGGCASQSDAAKQQAAAATDQAQTALEDQSPTAKKKKCTDQTGSRLAPCGEGSTGDYVAGTSGEAYKENVMGRPAPSARPN